jgi:hypothetical protein
MIKLKIPNNLSIFIIQHEIKFDADADGDE